MLRKSGVEIRSTTTNFGLDFGVAGGRCRLIPWGSIFGGTCRCRFWPPCAHARERARVRVRGCARPWAGMPAGERVRVYVDGCVYLWAGALMHVRVRAARPRVCSCVCVF